jgi:hypothetical protein
MTTPRESGAEDPSQAGQAALTVPGKQATDVYNDSSRNLEIVWAEARPLQGRHTCGDVSLAPWRYSSL